MSNRCSVADARRGLPSLIRQAEAGAEIEITRRGKPVAVLISLHVHQQLKSSRPQFKQAYADFLARFDPAEVGLDDDFISSLRDSSAGREVDL